MKKRKFLSVVNSNKTVEQMTMETKTKLLKQINIQPRTNLELMCRVNNQYTTRCKIL
jgi:hypothetical protein